MEKRLVKELKEVVKALGDKSLKVETYTNPLAGRLEVYLKRSGQYVCSLNLKDDKVILWIQAPNQEKTVEEVAFKLKEKGFKTEIVK
ncbi:MAG: hypothetical protein QXK12_04230 [Candidatus Nezhaarchaeales archaeon]